MATKHRSLLTTVVVLLFAATVVQSASAQVTYRKWDMYGGYTYLNTPTNSVSQYGYNLSFGHNLNNWLALGMDFSNFRGEGAQQATGGDLASRLPSSVGATLPPQVLAALPGISVNVPAHLSTTTFAAGTQFEVRKIKWVTPFFRPFLGVFHNKAQGQAAQITPVKLPTGVTPQMLAAVLASIPKETLDKALTQDATVLGYGAGAGVDINFTRPIGIRFSTDYIRTPLFGARQNNVRIGFGLIYRFGRDVTVK